MKEEVKKAIETIKDNPEIRVTIKKYFGEDDYLRFDEIVVCYLTKEESTLLREAITKKALEDLISSTAKGTE